MKNISKVCILSALLLGFSPFVNAAEPGASAPSKADPSAQDFANAFHIVAGKFDGKHKINHTKGFSAIGTFKSAKNLKDFYDIPMLTGKGKIDAEVRYSVGGPNPHGSDKTPGLGLGIKLKGNGSEWDMALASAPINFAKTKEQFLGFLQSRFPDKDGKVDPKKFEEFVKTSKPAQRFLAYNKIRGISRSVSNVAYYSLHAYMFKTADGKMQPARFVFVPARGERTLSKEELAKTKDNYLEDTFKKDLKAGSIKYYMYIIPARADDVIDDTSMPWDDLHAKIYVGTLNVTKYEGHKFAQDVFIPGVMPKGVGAPKDALFELRNHVYGITFSERQ
ncbi:catalase [Helicobacter sp. 13S00401-1]|uniref:catalase n=1 Tax=Helicobacter sp. 13S00401-1 TaxID=1905758 RepID=UPI00155295BB|nr:catalase [Helicobacter sp. 13S00401-1]